MDEFLRQFLMFLAASTDESTPTSGGSSDEATEETPPTPKEQPPATDEEQLGEGGKKALQAEREARKQADKRVADLEAQLAQTGTANDQALQEAQTLAQQAQDDLAKSQADVARYKVAARFGINTEANNAEDGTESPSDAEMFLTGSTEEELISQAQRLAAIRQASLDDALVDPTQGGGRRPAPVDPDPGAPRLAGAIDAQINK